MRLPVRLAGLLCLPVFAAGVCAAGAQELGGGALSQAPQQITRIESAAPHTTEAAPQPLGFEEEVTCFGYLGSSNEHFLAQVVGAQETADQVDFTVNNLVYLNAGADRGIKTGDEYWFVRPEDGTIIHPYSGKEMGRFYDYLGRGRVICVMARTAIVQVIHACTEIPDGSYVKAYDPVPIPLGRKTPPAVACDPPSGKAKGRIVYARDGVYQVAADTDVLIDIGLAEGLSAGDFLTIYRYSSGFEYGIRPEGSYWINVPPPAGVEIPRTYLGEMAILYVGDRWAVARVNESVRLIEIGDQVEIK